MGVNLQGSIPRHRCFTSDDKVDSLLDVDALVEQSLVCNAFPL